MFFWLLGQILQISKEINKVPSIEGILSTSGFYKVKVFYGLRMFMKCRISKSFYRYETPTNLITRGIIPAKLEIIVFTFSFHNVLDN